MPSSSRTPTAADPSSTPVDEAGLIRRFREEGDGAAFETLYRLHRRMVYGTCLRYLGRPEAAEDACHDVFLQAHQRFDTLRSDALRPWLRSIAVNHCLNQQRRASTRRRFEPVLIHQLDHSRDDLSHGTATARQELRIAAQLVRGLSPKQRLVFLLRHVEQLGYDAIVEVTGLSFGEVRSALQNARRNFRLGWQRRLNAARRDPVDGEVTTERTGERSGEKMDEEVDCG